jgi:lysine 2,3-aminomutase
MVGPKGDSFLSPEALDRAFAYIAAHEEIWEVILTGGDPFALSLRRIEEIMARLSAIDHVKIVRFHTRVPAVDPARITPEFVEILRNCGKTVYVALHANHPRELTPEARAACARLVDAGIPLLGQTVLLRGVNDDIETLAALMRAFVEMRIKPYYLHHPDLARGTAHFRVPIETGRALMQALQGRLSGLCQPAYMLDIPGGYGKAPIGPAYIAPTPHGYEVMDFNGRRHVYPPSAPSGA